jgi:hypothetical protein
VNLTGIDGATGATGSTGSIYQTTLPSLTLSPTQGGSITTSITPSLAYTAGSSITVTSTTVVPNLYVARANVADFNAITTVSTGTYYMTFANAVSGNVSENANSIYSANIANGSISANLFVGQLSGNITNATTVLDSAGTGYQVGYRAMPQSTNGSGTFVLADSGKHLYLAGGVTVPNNTSVAFDIGTVITVISNATALTITQGTGVTLRLANSATTGSRSLAANGIASCTKVASDTWYVSGMGVT